jgi:peptidoglycan/LPS O-acetylase OafA/YrhL
MKRVRYFDLLRIFCFGLVICYHMLMQLWISGYYGVQRINLFYETKNMHVATLAVAVFFLLSGAGLMIGYRDHFDWKRFYIKRFIKIMIPFYVVNLVYALYRMVDVRSFRILDPGVAPWKILLGILGIDEWLALYEVESFSQRIGEWFLGCLIIFYALFPLFRFLFLKYKAYFLAAVMAVYIYFAFFYDPVTDIHQNIVVKGCEFVFGMYLGQYWQKISKKWLLLTLPIIGFALFCPVHLPLAPALSITLLAVSVFVTAAFLEPVLWKSRIIYPWIQVFCTFSYELFLVHHLVIYRVTPLWGPVIGGKKGVLTLFLYQIITMILLALAIKWICDRIGSFLSKKWLPKPAFVSQR